MLASERVGFSVALFLLGNPNMYSGRYIMYWNCEILATLSVEALMKGKM